jgi:hypothetical protein
MPLFVTEHRHPAEMCPEKDPQMAEAPLLIVSPSHAPKAGIEIHAEVVANGSHHLYVTIGASDEGADQSYFAHFGRPGTLEITPASHCE